MKNLIVIMLLAFASMFQSHPSDAKTLTEDSGKSNFVLAAHEPAAVTISATDATVLEYSYNVDNQISIYSYEYTSLQAETNVEQINQGTVSSPPGNQLYSYVDRTNYLKIPQHWKYLKRNYWYSGKSYRC